MLVSCSLTHGAHVGMLYVCVDVILKITIPLLKCVPLLTLTYALRLCHSLVTPLPNYSASVLEYKTAGETRERRHNSKHIKTHMMKAHQHHCGDVSSGRVPLTHPRRRLR